MIDHDNTNSLKSPTERTYRGCSTIGDYDLLRKLGEGTFGYAVRYEIVIIFGLSCGGFATRSPEFKK